MARGADESKKSKIGENVFKHPQTIIVYDIGSFRLILGVLELEQYGVVVFYRCVRGGI